MSDEVRNHVEEERAEAERRISDYRAIVALFIAGTDKNSMEVERVFWDIIVDILAISAAVTFFLWLLWKF